MITNHKIQNKLTRYINTYTVNYISTVLVLISHLCHLIVFLFLMHNKMESHRLNTIVEHIL